MDNSQSPFFDFAFDESLLQRPDGYVESEDDMQPAFPFDNELDLSAVSFLASPSTLQPIPDANAPPASIAAPQTAISSADIFQDLGDTTHAVVNPLDLHNHADLLHPPWLAAQGQAECSPQRHVASGLHLPALGSTEVYSDIVWHDNGLQTTCHDPTSYAWTAHHPVNSNNAFSVQADIQDQVMNPPLSTLLVPTLVGTSDRGCHVPAPIGTPTEFYRYNQADILGSGLHHTNTGSSPSEIQNLSQLCSSSQSTDTALHLTSTLPKSAFPLSRPVSLPPARTGGRRGKQPAPEKASTAAVREHGVCIRCRKSNSKCGPGLPCSSCHSKAKSTLWQYPCTKAEFFDIVEFGPIFRSTTSFQSGIIANMTTTEFWEGMAYTGINSQTVNFSIITTGHPQLVEARGMIPWLHSAAFLVNICTSASKTAKEDSVERMLSRALATSSKARQTAPLVCFPQSSTSSPWNEWTLPYLFLCSTPYSHQNIRVNSANVMEEVELGNERRILDLIVWCGRRQFELTVYGGLQNILNRRSGLTTERRVELALTLWNLLCFGLARATVDGSTYLEYNDSETPEEGELLDRQKRLRQALLCYLRVCLNDLPAWHNFWKTHHDTSVSPIAMDMIRRSLQTPDSFETELNCQVTKAFRKFDLWLEWTKSIRLWQDFNPNAIDDEPDTSEEVPITCESIDILTNVLSGRDILMSLSEEYEPRLLLLRGCVDDLGDFQAATDVSNMLTEVLSRLKRLHSKLSKALEERDSGGVWRMANDQDQHDVIEEVFKFMAEQDEIIIFLQNMFQELVQRVKNGEIEV